MLTRLKYRLDRAEYLLKRDAFQKAHRFIDGASAIGGVGPTKPCMAAAAAARSTPGGHARL